VTRIRRSSARLWRRAASNALAYANDFRTCLGDPDGPQEREPNMRGIEVSFGGKDVHLVFCTDRFVAKGTELLWDCEQRPGLSCLPFWSRRALTARSPTAQMGPATGPRRCTTQVMDKRRRSGSASKHSSQS
jgi:hypothetical protein